jgi:hypothetical protein
VAAQSGCNWYIACCCQNTQRKFLLAMKYKSKKVTKKSLIWVAVVLAVAGGG